MSGAWYGSKYLRESVIDQLRFTRNLGWITVSIPRLPKREYVGVPEQYGEQSSTDRTLCGPEWKQAAQRMFNVPIAALSLIKEIEEGLPRFQQAQWSVDAMSSMQPGCDVGSAMNRLAVWILSEGAGFTTWSAESSELANMVARLHRVSGNGQRTEDQEWDEARGRLAVWIWHWERSHNWKTDPWEPPDVEPSSRNVAEWASAKCALALTNRSDPFCGLSDERAVALAVSARMFVQDGCDHFLNHRARAREEAYGFQVIAEKVLQLFAEAPIVPDGSGIPESARKELDEWGISYRPI